MLRSHIDRCVYGRVFCLQRGTIHRRQWPSWKAHENLEEMAIATVRRGERVQTMGKRAATAVLPEVIAVAIVIANRWETAAAEQPEMRLAHWEGQRWKGPQSASSSERRRTCSCRMRRW